MEFRIPEPLKAEHDDLHAELVDATRAGGRVGEAAKEVSRRLHPHFSREEPLAKGTIMPGMAGVLALTDRLEAGLPNMLAEHKEILAALSDLVVAAKAENKPKYARFAELILHARTEEEVLYPAAILVGRCAKLGLGK